MGWIFIHPAKNVESTTSTENLLKTGECKFDLPSMAPGYNLLHLVLESMMISRAGFFPLQEKLPRANGKLFIIVIYYGDVYFISYVISHQSKVFYSMMAILLWSADDTSYYVVIILLSSTAQI